jgi:spore germination cell wall hydrolase CwlJ-like protein
LRVVNQPSQFSFVHHHTQIKTGSRTWRNAVAVARIAHADRWKSQAEGALYFHARVKPHCWPRARGADRKPRFLSLMAHWGRA